MKRQNQHERVEMVPIDRIHILNPRARNRHQHREIVENIQEIGLKRPITVSRYRRPDGTEHYNLVCGQGRIEAFLVLNQTEIPPFVTGASGEECLLMSLVENVARSHHRPIDLMREIGNLHSRGNTDAEIATKIGVTQSWVSMITGLLERGEDRLLAAVETGLVPVSMATEIARSSEPEMQDLLIEAYEQGSRGKKLTGLRRLLEQRAKRQKAIGNQRMGTHRNARKKLTALELQRVYEREAEKQKLMVKKATFTHDRLVFATEAMKDLTADVEFTKLMRSEGLATMPKILKDRIHLGA